MWGIKDLCRGSCWRHKNTFQSSGSYFPTTYWGIYSTISPPLPFKAQFWPQQLDDLAHGLIDITLLNASHKPLQQLHSEELTLLTQPRTHQGVCTCTKQEINVTQKERRFASCSQSCTLRYCTGERSVTNGTPNLNYAWFHLHVNTQPWSKTLSYNACSTRHSRDELCLGAASDCPTLFSQALAYCPQMKHSEASERG